MMTAVRCFTVNGPFRSNMIKESMKAPAKANSNCVCTAILSLCLFLAIPDPLNPIPPGELGAVRKYLKHLSCHKIIYRNISLLIYFIQLDAS